MFRRCASRRIAHQVAEVRALQPASRMRSFLALGLWCFIGCGGHADNAPPGRESTPVAEPNAQRAAIAQCGHVDALCPSVLDDGAARSACGPGRSVHIGACATYSVLYVRDGVDTGERCYYDEAGSLFAAVRYVAVRETCAYGPVTFIPPDCPSDDGTTSNDLCRAPAIE
jgi:hypothetical protein